MARMSEQPIRRRVVVHGHVQGVFFREQTRRQAEAAGVAGWVRNRPDGTVEALFEGPADAVEALVAFCRRGPERARVERVDLEEAAPQAERGFRVR
jgi:acylphosphatase